MAVVGLAEDVPVDTRAAKANKSSTTIRAGSSPIPWTTATARRCKATTRNAVTGTQYLQPDPEPLPQQHENAAPRIFAFIDDLFFLAKIQETSRKLNVKVEFVKTEKDILERMAQNGNGKPSLIIFDLNNLGAKPLATIPRLKKELKKGTTIIGFLSHVQGDLKVKAMEAGCDMVIPRSAFSQNLPSLLRRHGAPDELDVQ